MNSKQNTFSWLKRFLSLLEIGKLSWKASQKILISESICIIWCGAQAIWEGMHKRDTHFPFFRLARCKLERIQVTDTVEQLYLITVNQFTFLLRSSSTN